MRKNRRELKKEIMDYINDKTRNPLKGTDPVEMMKKYRDGDRDVMEDVKNLENYFYGKDVLTSELKDRDPTLTFNER